MARPVCVHCGKPYGQRETQSEVVRWPEGGTMPPYQGSGFVVKEHYHGFHNGNGRSSLNGVDVTGVHSAYRHIWDGVTWFGGYDPFCTLRCALLYARKAYAKEKTA